MAFALSFPNCLCLMLTGVLVVHMIDRDLMPGNFPELPDNMEVLYCKLPQSYQREDTRRCSSAQLLFTLLGNDCSLERKSVEPASPPKTKNETEEEDHPAEDNFEEVVTVEVDEEMEREEEKTSEDGMTSSLVDSFVISLLVCSAIVSLLEWYKEKTRIHDQNGNGENVAGGGGESVSDRRFSLADLTVNRHIRRRDSQHQETIRQPFASSGCKPPPLIRRSSFPAQFPEARSRHAPQRQQSNPGLPLVHRMSIDLTEDDSSPDRRRVRFIRRH